MEEKERKGTGPRLSERLYLIASFVSPGSRLADIGTDHAFLPVRLLMDGRIPYAYCCDIGRGPLARAEEHVKNYGLEDRTELRLSDGLAGLKPGEADSVLIAGMGGQLMVRILRDGAETADEDGRTLKNTVREWIFSPHTELREFRGYLRENGFRITREALLREDGKYYFVIRAVGGDGEEPYRWTEETAISAAAAERFGPLLLKARDPLLRRFMERELKKEEAILSGLGNEETASAGKRRAELTVSTAEIRDTLEKVFSGN